MNHGMVHDAKKIEKLSVDVTDIEYIMKLVFDSVKYHSVTSAYSMTSH